MNGKKIKFIQINIYGGKYLDGLIEFLKDEEPDFVSMQEVALGKFSLYRDKTIDVFLRIKESLRMHGVFNGDVKLSGDPSSVFGNAVLSKYKILDVNVLTLKKFRPITLDALNSNRGNIREQ